MLKLELGAISLYNYQIPQQIGKFPRYQWEFPLFPCNLTKFLVDLLGLLLRFPIECPKFRGISPATVFWTQLDETNPMVPSLS